LYCIVLTFNKFRYLFVLFEICIILTFNKLINSDSSDKFRNKSFETFLNFCRKSVPAWIPIFQVKFRKKIRNFIKKKRFLTFFFILLYRKSVPAWIPFPKDKFRKKIRNFSKKTFFNVKNVFFFIFYMQKIGSNVDADISVKFRKIFETFLKNVFFYILYVGNRLNEDADIPDKFRNIFKTFLKKTPSNVFFLYFYIGNRFRRGYRCSR
jgi:hypothetical protein